jgi:hypothetical protein
MVDGGHTMQASYVSNGVGVMELRVDALLGLSMKHCVVVLTRMGKMWTVKQHVVFIFNTTRTAQPACLHYAARGNLGCTLAVATEPQDCGCHCGD